MMKKLNVIVNNFKIENAAKPDGNQPAVSPLRLVVSSSCNDSLKR